MCVCVLCVWLWFSLLPSISLQLGVCTKGGEKSRFRIFSDMKWRKCEIKFCHDSKISLARTVIRSMRKEGLFLSMLQKKILMWIMTLWEASTAPQQWNVWCMLFFFFLLLCESQNEFLPTHCDNTISDNWAIIFIRCSKEKCIRTTHECCCHWWMHGTRRFFYFCTSVSKFLSIAKIYVLKTITHRRVDSHPLFRAQIEIAIEQTFGLRGNGSEEKSSLEVEST